MNNIAYNTVGQILEGYVSKGITRWVRDLIRFYDRNHICAKPIKTNSPNQILAHQ